MPSVPVEFVAVGVGFCSVFKNVDETLLAVVLSAITFAFYH
ncbi:Unknown protein sequence [Pseudomonas savastanoi pv. glycinea]|uniref:Uncharacterized protein n=1 Tax=Pseudomonas savastanoi pv. glycinea TaxID=318 RepID=A0ABR5L3N0_PSESG|nr:Unknown protein sequence [Pseudomonas amygdali pv. sesami]KPB43726.1 Unknown protein sequence [Pseudomonas savastanoi pv. phaseolicola]KPB82982.1 Unknown protein sequence [Pseudomonas syringae pv. maculicola]KPC01005.1 Unknown protein sequence [Pseudomonas amygdali pv. lachrymans]KPC34785.1 Unknown protein sequence [Pseudomonas savastanoi pv. glycinea]